MSALASSGLNEQQFFIRTLHHANHDSSISRLKVGKGQYSSSDLVKLESYDPLYNTYISLHGFSKYGRKAENIREITCIYYDLDMHKKAVPLGYIEECIENTLSVLDDAIYGNECIPEPTMITRTGRGIGMFYVLDRSIACSKGRNAGQVEFWNLIYKKLGKKIKDILIPDNNSLADDPDAILELDERIICDVSRVVRMPMTINQATGKSCRILSVAEKNGSIKYYTLKELSAFAFDSVYSGKRDFSNKIVRTNLRPKTIYVDFVRQIFLRERMQNMRRLQEFRKGNCEGVRDYMCFIYYNHAKQIFGAEEGVLQLKEFNSRFSDPLEDKEIENIVKGIDKNKCTEYEGYYRLPDRWIIKNCQISEEEQEKAELNFSKRKIERLAAHEEKQKIRSERNEAVIQYINDHPGETYTQIAGVFQISRRTLQNITKNAGIRRHHSKDVPQKEKKEKCNLCKKLSHSICCVSPAAGQRGVSIPANTEAPIYLNDVKHTIQKDQLSDNLDTQFERIPLSQENLIKFTQKQIDEIQFCIKNTEEKEGKRSPSVKQLEKQRRSLEGKLKELNDAPKDDVVTFEQLGVDRLFVDESHNYKNLYLYTKMRNVAGVQSTEAKKSTDLYNKCQYLDDVICCEL